MAETAFATTSPWSGTLKRGRHGGGSGEPGITIAESRGGAMALLTLRKGQAADLARVAASRGIELPATPRWTRAQGIVALWAGPGQWLLRRAGAFSDLEAEFVGFEPYATLIDQSHSRATLTVGGEGVRDMLAKGFEIDLHARAFRPGDIAMTAAAGISTMIWQLDDKPTYEIAVPRSMAGSFWHWLSEASGEYGAMVGDRTADVMP